MRAVIALHRPTIEFADLQQVLLKATSSRLHAIMHRPTIEFADLQQVLLKATSSR